MEFLTRRRPLSLDLYVDLLGRPGQKTGIEGRSEIIMVRQNSYGKSVPTTLEITDCAGELLHRSVVALA